MDAMPIAPEPPVLRQLRVALGDPGPGSDYGYFGSRIRWRDTVPDDARRSPMWLEEEYFEYLFLAEAIAEAGSTFVMAELGAGFGRWSVTGAIGAARMGRQVKLIAVEAEHRHFAMMLEHFAENGLDPAEHRLINAAVNGTRGEVFFTQGNSEKWWGQAILPSVDCGHGQGPEVTTEKIDAVTLEDVLIGVPRLDLIDCDIQGAEGDVIASNMALLTEKARRVFVGTHSEALEARLREAFSKAEWSCRFDYAGAGTRETTLGALKFVDGVQCWINPRLPRS